MRAPFVSPDQGDYEQEPPAPLYLVHRGPEEEEQDGGGDAQDIPIAVLDNQLSGYLGSFGKIHLKFVIHLVILMFQMRPNNQIEVDILQ